MIQVVRVSKSYGKQILFQDANFSLNAGERLGLVGRNGNGKSTLFKLIIGEEHPDSGEIRIPADYRIGHLSQHLSFSAPTVLEEGCQHLPQRDGWVETHRVEAVLAGLGFLPEDLRKPPSALSGGLQIRLNLVKLLVSEPNLLLLDEPTNYLDIVSVRWLRRFLLSWNGECMLITHDRGFMDSVTTHTVGIHRTKVRKVSGGTEKYYAQLAQEEAIQEQTRLNQEKKVRETEDFIRRFRAKASKAKAVQSRIKALEKMEVIEELSEIEELEFKFAEAPFPGKWLLETQELGFRYPSSKEALISGLSIAIGKGDRIGVIGKNGKGKSTLLSVLAGELQPTEGAITRSPNLALGYFGQTNVERLHRDWTVEEEIFVAQGGDNRTVARGVCGLMMFQGDLALKQVRVLSGGEKSRVLLGKILLTPANLLLLDEPTNHLDVESNAALLDAVERFSGAVILVTHDEAMLSRLARRLIVFDQGQVTLHEGGYQDFLSRVGWQDEGFATQKEGPTGAQPAAQRTTSRKELRRLRADIINRRSRELGPLRQKVSELEAAIMDQEQVVAEQTAQLIESSKDGFGEEAAKLSRALHSSKAKIDTLFEELNECTVRLEQQERRFEEELRALDEG